MTRVTTLERLVARAAEQHGFVRAADATELGIDPTRLRKLAAAGRLDRRGHGLYRFNAFPATAHDEFHEAVLAANGVGVIAGEAALALWELADVNPRQIELVVPRTYTPRRRGHERYKFVRRNLDPADIDTVDNIPTLTPQLAIADAIKAGIAGELIEQAIANARARRLIGQVAEARLRVQLADRAGRPTRRAT